MQVIFPASSLHSDFGNSLQELFIPSSENPDSGFVLFNVWLPPLDA